LNGANLEQELERALAAARSAAQRRRARRAAMQRSTRLSSAVYDSLAESWAATCGGALAARAQLATLPRHNNLVRRASDALVVAVMLGCFPLVGAVAASLATLNFVLVRLFMLARRARSRFAGRGPPKVLLHKL
jgi:hypothetical protein